jgi:hypothetical protein
MFFGRTTSILVIFLLSSLDLPFPHARFPMGKGKFDIRSHSSGILKIWGYRQRNPTL